MSKYRNLLTKLLSRKFLMALVPNIVAFAAIFNFPENEVAVVASAVVIIISSVGYMIIEGRCDLASIGNVVNALQEAIEMINRLESNTTEEKKEATPEATKDTAEECDSSATITDPVVEDVTCMTI